MFEIKILSDSTENGIRNIKAETCQMVCSSLIDISLEGNVIRNVQVLGGCHGNLQGVSALLAGMKASEAVARLEGINCKGRGTSCPDQIARVLKSI